MELRSGLQQCSEDMNEMMAAYSHSHEAADFRDGQLLVPSAHNLHRRLLRRRVQGVEVRRVHELS